MVTKKPLILKRGGQDLAMMGRVLEALRTFPAAESCVQAASYALARAGPLPVAWDLGVPWA